MQHCCCDVRVIHAAGSQCINDCVWIWSGATTVRFMDVSHLWCHEWGLFVQPSTCPASQRLLALSGSGATTVRFMDVSHLWRQFGDGVGVVCVAVYLSRFSTFVGPGSPGTIRCRPDATLAFELSIDKVSLFKLVLVTWLGLLQESTTQFRCDWTRTDQFYHNIISVIFIIIERHNTCVYCLNNPITHTVSISMHGYNEVSNYTLYKQ